jgi:hypothetical protein
MSRSVRFLSGLLLTALGAGCAFHPVNPAGTASCDSDDDCPADARCRPVPAEPTTKMCCKGSACPAEEGPPDAARQAMASVSDGAAPADAGARPDLESVLPPLARHSDGGLDALSGDAGGEAKSLVSCSSGIATPLPPLTGRESYCTIVANSSYVYLGIDSITMNDPVSVRAYAVCSAALPLGAETTDSSGAGGALSKPTLELLVELVNHFQQLCQPHHARLVGMLATGWARAAVNQNEIRARLAEGTGLTLDIPTPEQELEQRYYGVSRYRRGRIVLDPSYDRAELLSWPAQAAGPVRTVVPVGYAASGSMYFSSPSYQSSEDARRALRGRLSDELKEPLAELEAQVRKGGLEATVSVGPVGPVVPLAVGGKLRNADGSWFDAAQWKTVRDAATVTTSPYGRVYGTVLPEQIDHLLSSIGAGQFAQLRSEPIRDAYGLELLYDATLLDLLADEVKTTEFGFVFTNSHFGYLFTKLYPPPR